MNQHARRWIGFVWRFFFVLLFLLVVFALPVSYILFTPSLLNPLALLAMWPLDHLVLRLLSVLTFIVLLSALVGLLFLRELTRTPFQDLAELIRRIGTGDFHVRSEPSTTREPHELIEIREALYAMAADLEHAEQLRNNMMADVSHELRTPLTALEGTLRAALDHVYPLEDADIANLYGQTRHLIRLVNDLHELALADDRQLPLDMQPTDVTDLVGETVQIFAPLAAERDVILRINSSSLPFVTIDAGRIRQVLHNILTNALRHTPPRGEIAVSSHTEGEQIVIAVRDTGDGLEPEQINAVFDRFYRTDRSRSRDTGGTGLGLAIVNAIVTNHGGTVDAWSAGLGTGSVFTIRLPIR